MTCEMLHVTGNRAIIRENIKNIARNEKYLRVCGISMANFEAFR